MSSGLIHSSRIIDLAGPPTYNAGTQTSLIYVPTGTYANFSPSATNAGWTSRDGGNGPDGVTDGGHNTICTPGYDGVSGSGFRVIYDGRESTDGPNYTGNLIGNEARSLKLATNDVLVGKHGHALYADYYCRLTGRVGYTNSPIIDEGSALNVPSLHIPAIKFFVLFHSGGFARAQFATRYSGVCNNNPYTGAGGAGTLFAVQSNINVVTPGLGEQCSPPFVYTLQGTWMRLQFVYEMASHAGIKDGRMEMWINGTKVISVKQENVGVQPPNAQLNGGYVAGYPTWCIQEDVDAFWSNDDNIYIDSILWSGDLNLAGLMAFYYDVDNIRVWRD